MRAWNDRWHPLAAAFALCLWPAAAALAKPPGLDHLFPAGACRGSEVEITATGSFDRWPVRGWVSGGADVAIEALPEKGKLKVHVCSDALPGLRWVRLFDEQGASALRPLVVGTLPEVLETEPNDDPLKPQKLACARVTVNGRLAQAGDVDSFAVELKRGQSLVASLEANRRLGAPMDAVLQIASEAGFVLAQNDDDHGMDPQLVFPASADGTYIVRTFAFPATPNSSIKFAGGEAFIYRLTLTTGGFANHCLPLALERGQPGRVELFGWNLADRSIELCSGADETNALVWHPSLANTLEVRWVDHASVVEQEPNDRGRPQTIALPTAVSGQIDPAGDEDVFAFTAKKGQSLVFRLESRTLGFPLDPLLRLLDDAGTTLAENDDSSGGRDAELSFRVPRDGTFRLRVRDLNQQGGPRFAYLLTAAAPSAEFELSVSAEPLVLKAGKPLELNVTVNRKNGFDRPITIRASGLPEGVKAQGVESQVKDSTSKLVKLRLEPERAGVSGPFQIVGESAGETPLRRRAQAAIPVLKVPCPDLWLTVLPDTEKKP